MPIIKFVGEGTKLGSRRLVAKAGGHRILGEPRCRGRGTARGEPLLRNRS
jgi:hypothetical protein